MPVLCWIYFYYDGNFLNNEGVVIESNILFISNLRSFSFDNDNNTIV